MSSDAIPSPSRADTDWLYRLLRNVPLLVVATVAVAGIGVSWGVSQSQISDLRETVRRIDAAHQSDHDALTGLVQDVRWIRSTMEKQDGQK